MEKRWYVQQQDSDLVGLVERVSQVPGVVARLLVSRGIIEQSSVSTFLDAKLSQLRDPELLPGLTNAADRIHSAIFENKRIVIYGDYDADGMTSTAILYRCLKILHADVSYYVPNRMSEGYGLNCKAIEKLAKAGTSLIISVDCGIGSLEPARTAIELGVDLIVTDHHKFGEELPDATAIVHPFLPGSDYPFHGLCGAGVVFKLAWAICQRASESKRVNARCRNFLLAALGLAAIGTVADVVPLVDENRIIVKHGLKCLKENKLVGIDCLLRLTKLDQNDALTSDDIGFVLGPRLNAAGRLGQAQLGVELLTTDDPQRAQSLADYLDELNNSRSSLERSILKSATKQAKERFDPQSDPALVLSSRGWHKGVIGIVAGRLAEKYYRPVVVIAMDDLGNDAAVGSARSIPGVDLHRALSECHEHLVTHGGHAAAAGFRIDEPHIDQFRAHFCERIAQQYSHASQVAEVRIDTEANLPSMTLRTVRQIDLLAPFGEGNPRPTFCAMEARLAAAPKAVGKTERHVSLTLEQHGVQLRAIAFNKPEWMDQLNKTEGLIDIAYRPIINEFRGRRSVELQMVDWRSPR